MCVLVIASLSPVSNQGTSCTAKRSHPPPQPADTAALPTPSPSPDATSIHKVVGAAARPAPSHLLAAAAVAAAGAGEDVLSVHGLVKGLCLKVTSLKSDGDHKLRERWTDGKFKSMGHRHG